MTDLLDKAIATARGLPPETQDDIARMVLAFLGGDQTPVYVLTAEERAEQDGADAEEARGEYATDVEIRAVWAKHGA